jgi:hypothetical protein
MMSRRIQRRRTKGWRMPPGCVYVGRPTKWGNPFSLDEWHPARVRDDFRRWVRAPEQAELRAAARRELRGKDLCCWCHEDAEWCHADEWLVIAASESEEE